MNINLYDIIISLENIENIPKGTIGTIVKIWETDKLYEVEFEDEKHKSIGCLTLNISQFRKMNKDEISKL